MAYIGNFSTAQAIGLKSIVVLTDSSTGTDVLVVGRRIFLQKSDGTYLVPTGTLTTYIDFPLIGGATINLDVLSKDMCLSITVNWLSVTNTVLYTKTILYVFIPYAKTFFYYLTQLQAASNISFDTNYFANKAQLWVEINAASNATVLGGDIAASQNCLDRAALLVNHQNIYY